MANVNTYPTTADRTGADLATAAGYFHALADETRLRILELLRSGERCVCDLAAGAEVAQPRLSYHLRALREAGILLGRRDGRWIYYRINPAAVAELTRLGQLLCCEDDADCCSASPPREQHWEADDGDGSDCGHQTVGA